MSRIVFPLVARGGSRLRVDRRFPSNSELVSLSAENWPAFMAQYSADTVIDIRAPMDGTIHFVQKSAHGLPMTLLAYKPINFADLHNIPDWAAPAAKAFLFSFSELDDESMQLEIYTKAMRQYRDRHGNRLVRGTFAGGALRSHENWLLDPSQIAERARIALSLRASIFVSRGQILASTAAAHQVFVGMVYYEGSDLAAVSPYWLDFHEYFTRYKAYFASEELGFPFDDEPSREYFRIRYEKSDNPKVDGENVIETLTGGLQAIQIFHPPTETIVHDGSVVARTRAIPGELFSFTPNARVRLRFSNSAVNYRLQLFDDKESTTPLHASGDLTGQEPETLFGNVGYTWPARRTAPYNLAYVAANGVGLSLPIVRDLIRVVDEAASEVIGHKTRIAEWLQIPGFAEKAILVDTINQIIRAAPEDLRPSLRNAIDNDRFTPFSATYHQHLINKERAVNNLIAALNADFIQQFKADPSDDAMIILDKAIEALRNEEQGDRFLEETFRGFLLDTPYVSDAARLLEFDLLKAIWNSQRRPRAALVKLLFEGVREDMFYHLRTAARRLHSDPEHVTGVLQEMHRQYTKRFGELFAIKVHEIPLVHFAENPLTGELTNIVYTYASPTRMTIEYDSNAISEIDVLRHNGVSGATYARDFLAKFVNVLNLIGTLLVGAGDLIHACKERDSEAYYNFVKTAVNFADDIYHLFPSRHSVDFPARRGWEAIGRGWAAISSGLSMIFNAISLTSMIDGAWDRHASGDYRSAGFTALSASTAMISLGAEGLALLGAGTATSGPLAFFIIGGTLLSVGFGLMAQLVADSGSGHRL